MARGREAARAAQRRAAEAAEKLGTAQKQADETRERAQEENQKLREEIAALHREMEQRAGQLAGQELAAARAATHTAGQQRAAAVEQLKEALDHRDHLVREACRYVSMTTGQPPMAALAVVSTWITGKRPQFKLPPAGILASLGLPAAGWAAHTLTHAGRAARIAATNVISLDEAEDSGGTHVHTAYRSDWYRDSRPPRPPQTVVQFRAR